MDFFTKIFIHLTIFIMRYRKSCIDFRDISVDTVQVLIGANVPQVLRVEKVRSGLLIYQMPYVPHWAGLYSVPRLHLYWKGTKMFVLCQRILVLNVMSM